MATTWQKLEAKVDTEDALFEIGYTKAESTTQTTPQRKRSWQSMLDSRGLNILPLFAPVDDQSKT